MELIEKIKNCFKKEELFYTQHAKEEMKQENFGIIKEEEIFQAVLNGEIIESYPEDDPYPSCLIFGKTKEQRPLHAVVAYSKEENLAILITTYQPDPAKWIDYARRRRV